MRFYDKPKSKEWHRTFTLMMYLKDHTRDKYVWIVCGFVMRRFDDCDEPWYCVPGDENHPYFC